MTSKSLEQRAALCAFYEFKESLYEELEKIKELDTVIDFGMNEITFVHKNGVRVIEKNGTIRID